MPKRRRRAPDPRSRTEWTSLARGMFVSGGLLFAPDPRGDWRVMRGRGTPRREIVRCRLVRKA